MGDCHGEEGKEWRGREALNRRATGNHTGTAYPQDVADISILFTKKNLYSATK